jgi:hypothetical protein
MDLATDYDRVFSGRREFTFSQPDSLTNVDHHAFVEYAIKNIDQRTWSASTTLHRHKLSFPRRTLTDCWMNEFR